METDSRRIVQRLEREGWTLKGTRGSHRKYEREGAIVIVPHPNKALPKGTARNIARHAGWLDE